MFKELHIIKVIIKFFFFNFKNSKPKTLNLLKKELNLTATGDFKLPFRNLCALGIDR